MGAGLSKTLKDKDMDRIFMEVQHTLRCIREYYESRRLSVRFFDNDLYFACEDLPEDQTP